MNVLGSEYSSGCESGWTLYLEHSLPSPNTTNRDITEHYYKGKQIYDEGEGEEEEEEEEDLSMVSDASSGPPVEEHFHGASSGKKRGTRERAKEPKRRNNQKQHSFLDDTASSPVFTNKNNHIATYHQASMESALDFSQGFSSNFEGRSAFQDHYGSGSQLPNNNQWFGGKRATGMR